jgi:hypothetical protein
MNKQAGNPDETNLSTHYRKLVYTNAYAAGKCPPLIRERNPPSNRTKCWTTC